MNTKNADEIDSSPTHYDEPAFHLEVLKVTQLLKRSTKALCTHDIKQKVRLNPRYNLLDLLACISVQEVGVKPVRYLLTEKIPVKRYNPREWAIGGFNAESVKR